MIFHSFVNLPEGNISKSCENSTIHWLIIHIVYSNMIFPCWNISMENIPHFRYCAQVLAHEPMKKSWVGSLRFLLNWYTQIPGVRNNRKKNMPGVNVRKINGHWPVTGKKKRKIIAVWRSHPAVCEFLRTLFLFQWLIALQTSDTKKRWIAKSTNWMSSLISLIL